MSSFFKSSLCLSLLLVFSSQAFGQQGNVDELVQESKNDLMVVVAGGVAGAVLGLSTLSFVDEPREHTKNILVGASIGIIAGVAYVAFAQANKSKDLIYGSAVKGSELMPDGDFATSARRQWHHESLVFAQRESTQGMTALGLTFQY